MQKRMPTLISDSQGRVRRVHVGTDVFMWDIKAARMHPSRIIYQDTYRDHSGEPQGWDLKSEIPVTFTRTIYSSSRGL